MDHIDYQSTKKNTIEVNGGSLVTNILQNIYQNLLQN